MFENRDRGIALAARATGSRRRARAPAPPAEAGAADGGRLRFRFRSGIDKRRRVRLQVLRPPTPVPFDLAAVRSVARRSSGADGRRQAPTAAVRPSRASAGRPPALARCGRPFGSAAFGRNSGVGAASRAGSAAGLRPRVRPPSRPIDGSAPQLHPLGDRRSSHRRTEGRRRSREHQRPTSTISPAGGADLGDVAGDRRRHFRVDPEARLGTSKRTSISYLVADPVNNFVIVPSVAVSPRIGAS